MRGITLLNRVVGFTAGVLMADCKYLPKCLYFKDKLKNMPIASELVKTMYCLWHYDECARYKVAMAMGSENVPSYLFLPETERAANILALFNHTKSK
jgi:hypothetical protein